MPAKDSSVAGRSAARADALTGSETNSYNLIFSVTAGDGLLGNVRYLNGEDRTATSVPLGAAGSAAGAVVTFSVTDGTVTTIVPYTSTKAAGIKPLAAGREGDVLTVRGAFSGIWDAAGRNVAPGGASSVRFDARTGTMLGFE
jgi:hypothetical protein